MELYSGTGIGEPEEQDNDYRDKAGEGKAGRKGRNSELCEGQASGEEEVRSLWVNIAERQVVCSCSRWQLFVLLPKVFLG